MSTLRDYGPVGFARMAGSSIAARDAAPWVTDFLNAAYYRRDGAPVDDLRLAFSILTTYWWRMASQRRLHASDLRAFHRVYFRERRRAQGTLGRTALLAGATELFGDWFAGTPHRGWGIRFPDAEARAAYRPERRLRLARLGELTPPRSPDAVSHTYPPVALPDPEAARDHLRHPETWPDFGSALGRFTPLRTGGLAGQTFEIEVATGTDRGLPIFTRGYVTCTLATDAAVELTTHQGHFLGPAVSRLELFEADGRTQIRDVGTWDPLKPHLALAYRLGGRAAQHAFWGGDAAPERSMLQQLALMPPVAR